MKLGKPDNPSSKNDGQSKCAGIYFKSIYLINGTAASKIWKLPGIFLWLLVYLVTMTKYFYQWIYKRRPWCVRQLPYMSHNKTYL